MTLTELLKVAYWKANICIECGSELIGLKTNDEWHMLKTNDEWHMSGDWDRFKDMEVSSFREAEGYINVYLKAASRLS